MPRLVHRASLGSLAARKAFGARAMFWPLVAALRLDSAPLPEPPPNAGLRRLRTVLAGICGSDLAALVGRSPTALWPLTSFPSVPGHEILARVADEAPDAGGLPAQRRVVVDPFISCAVRGLEPCPECAAGRTALCRRAGEAGGGVARGMLIGFCRDLPGGWSDALWAHPSQLHPVPDGVPDEAAVLVEPLSVAAHALLQVDWSGVERVLVVGAGTIGLSVIAAMRLLGLGAPLVAGRHRHQAAAAASLGGHPVVSDPGRWPRLGGATTVFGLLGMPLHLGGFDLVVDAVGTDRTLTQAARAVRSGGTLVRVGDVGTLPAHGGGDVWIPDVRILTPFGYGLERLADGRALHTFDLVMERMGELAPALGALVTHRFALADYRPALAAATGHGRSRSIKVAFRPDA